MLDILHCAVGLDLVRGRHYQVGVLPQALV